MAYLPARGDIVFLDYPAAWDDPEKDRRRGVVMSLKGEIVQVERRTIQGVPSKEWPAALVVSSKLFNEKGLAFVCPIAQHSAVVRTAGTVVSLLDAGTLTQGSIHCHQLRALDWRARNVYPKETVPRDVLDEVLARVEAIIFD